MGKRLRFVWLALRAGVAAVDGGLAWTKVVIALIVAGGIAVPTKLSAHVPLAIRIIVVALILFALFVEGAYRLNAGSPTVGDAQPSGPSIKIEMNEPNQTVDLSGAVFGDGLNLGAINGPPPQGAPSAGTDISSVSGSDQGEDDVPLGDPA